MKTAIEVRNAAKPALKSDIRDFQFFLGQEAAGASDPKLIEGEEASTGNISWVFEPPKTKK
jgi:hypothetical protein